MMLRHPSLRLALFCLTSLTCSAALAIPAPNPPDVPVRNYYLMDYNSGRVLAEQNADVKEAPASITKLMTAYIVFSELKKGNIKLTDEVPISKKAWQTGGSRSFVEVGTKVPLEKLILGMLVQSGNDATVALAEYIAGTTDAFAGYMNAMAKQLGMTNSHFMNPTGLPHPDHYTTARDIAILARALIHDFPEDYKYFSVQSFTYNNITQPNRDILLGQGGIDGLKTGHTDSAGYCLASSAKRDGMRLISVVLGGDKLKDRFSAASALLNYGFRFFKTKQLFDGHTPLGQIKVWKGQVGDVPAGPAKPVYVTVQQDQSKNLQVKTELRPQLTAPVAAGTQVGKVEVMLGDKLIKQVPVYTLSSVELGSWWQRLLDEGRMLIFN